jgi:hypothetical protein
MWKRRNEKRREEALTLNDSVALRAKIDIEMRLRQPYSSRRFALRTELIGESVECLIEGKVL